MYLYQAILFAFLYLPLFSSFPFEKPKFSWNPLNLFTADQKDDIPDEFPEIGNNLALPAVTDAPEDLENIVFYRSKRSLLNDHYSDLPQPWQDQSTQTVDSDGSLIFETDESSTATMSIRDFTEVSTWLENHIVRNSSSDISLLDNTSSESSVITTSTVKVPVLGSNLSQSSTVITSTPDLGRLVKLNILSIAISSNLSAIQMDKVLEIANDMKIDISSANDSLQILVIFDYITLNLVREFLSEESDKLDSGTESSSVSNAIVKSTLEYIKSISDETAVGMDEILELLAIIKVVDRSTVSNAKLLILLREDSIEISTYANLSSSTLTTNLSTELLFKSEDVHRIINSTLKYIETLSNVTTFKLGYALHSLTSANFISMSSIKEMKLNVSLTNDTLNIIFTANFSNISLPEFSKVTSIESESSTTIFSPDLSLSSEFITEMTSTNIASSSESTDTEYSTEISSTVIPNSSESSADTEFITEMSSIVIANSSESFDDEELITEISFTTIDNSSELITTEYMTEISSTVNFSEITNATMYASFNDTSGFSEENFTIASNQNTNEELLIDKVVEENSLDETNSIDENKSFLASFDIFLKRFSKRWANKVPSVYNIAESLKSKIFLKLFGTNSSQISNETYFNTVLENLRDNSNKNSAKPWSTLRYIDGPITLTDDLKQNSNFAKENVNFKSLESDGTLEISDMNSIVLANMLRFKQNILASSIKFESAQYSAKNITSILAFLFHNFQTEKMLPNVTSQEV